MSGLWEDIPPAVGPEADNVRRVGPDHPLDLYRGRDFAGRFLLALTADVTGPPLPEAPRLNGIDVELENGPGARTRLVIRLQDTAQADIFRYICDHLTTTTRTCPTGANEAGLRLILRRLRHWHDLLRRRRDHLLSPQELIGLTGELLFLRDRLLPALPAHPAIQAWRGGHQEEQDFALGRWQIEMKTQRATADQRLLISSEAQLDAANGILLLCHQRLADASPTEPGAVTLNGLVEAIRETLTDAGDATLDVFDQGLDAWRYGPRPEYDEDWWLLTGRDLYEVRDGFPRLTPDRLPPGVQNVHYEVRLSECLPYRVDLEATLTEVLG